MERRGFLKALAGALAVADVVKATPAVSAPVASGTYSAKVTYKRSNEVFVDYTGKYDLIVSPAQKTALDALRGQYPVLKPVRYDLAPPLTHRDIERMRKTLEEFA